MQGCQNSPVVDPDLVLIGCLAEHHKPNGMLRWNDIIVVVVVVWIYTRLLNHRTCQLTFRRYILCYMLSWPKTDVILVLEMYLIKGEDTFVVFFESQGKVVRLNEVFGGNIRSSKLHFSESPPMYFCIILSLKENNVQEKVTKPSSYSFQWVRERRKKSEGVFFCWSILLEQKCYTVIPSLAYYTPFLCVVLLATKKVLRARNKMSLFPCFKLRAQKIFRHKHIRDQSVCVKFRELWLRHCCCFQAKKKLEEEAKV